jgi:hypothetical protein
MMLCANTPSPNRHHKAPADASKASIPPNVISSTCFGCVASRFVVASPIGSA